MNRKQTEFEASTFAKQINAEYWPVSSLNGFYLFDEKMLIFLKFGIIL